jgi:tripartite-type tricarboxylate transporter receptor subunit TctC
VFRLRTRVAALLLAGASASVAGCAQQAPTGSSENYPSKQIQYVIPFDPGGESDVTARLQQQALEKAFGQPTVVSNRPGGGGAVAWSKLANDTRGDGYTIMGANLPHTVLQPMAREDAGYQTEDLKWAYIFESTPNALLVPENSPYETLEDFVEAAKEKKLTVGGSSDFSANHMGTLALNAAAGVDLTYVPFSGTGTASPALLGGQVDALMSYNTEAIDLQNKGVKVLAVASDKRLEQLPDVPTFQEKGFDIVEGAWRGVAVPPDTPDPVVQRIADAFAQVNQDAEVQAKMRNLGFELEDMGPQESRKFVEERKQEARQLLERFGLLKN